MTVVVAAVGGAAVGAGVWLIVQGLRRPRLDELLPPPTEEIDGAARSTGVLEQVKGIGCAVLARLGWPGRRTRSDLAACDTDVDTHRTKVVALTLAGAALFACTLTIAVPAASVLPMSAALAIGGTSLAACALAPGILLRARAHRQRIELRLATSVIADLVGVALAGGAGVTGALTAATGRGTGPAFGRIRRCLHEAHLRTRPPWDALTDLSRQTGVRELEELASSIRLAGADGARVRTSVRAKARSLRAHQLAALETEALEATERMSLPVMLLVLGFLLLMGYPAIVQVSNGF
ncbi:type II secretion system F family protein [Nocardiopsis sp. FIRDI 009]|uniref:type II secretion system F family protein n=1 Tax=Nocardiopsis sp. FIRDI 009 TaxID=714197 RepID=UPI000E27FE9E|nr:type II secretion system F family protein [Nocardiopsis sp. FIRDI 009]